MLTEQEKKRIKSDHKAFLEKRHLDIVKKLEEEERRKTRSKQDKELERIRQEEEETYYGDNPNYVKYTGSDGTPQWVNREEFEQKKYRKRRVRKKHERSWNKKLWEKTSVFVIVIAMILIIVLAFKIMDY